MQQLKLRIMFRQKGRRRGEQNRDERYIELGQGNEPVARMSVDFDDFALKSLQSCMLTIVWR
jgi:hypothetical protein